MTTLQITLSLPPESAAKVGQLTEADGITVSALFRRLIRAEHHRLGLSQPDVAACSALAVDAVAASWEWVREMERERSGGGS